MSEVRKSHPGSPRAEPCGRPECEALRDAVYSLDLSPDATAIVKGDPEDEITMTMPREIWLELYRAAELNGLL
jgi:hypothetical protein